MGEPFELICDERAGGLLHEHASVSLPCVSDNRGSLQGRQIRRTLSYTDASDDAVQAVEGVLEDQLVISQASRVVKEGGHMLYGKAGVVNEDLEAVDEADPDLV